MFTGVWVALSLPLLLENSRVFFKFSQMQVILVGMYDEMQLFNCLEILELILLFMLEALQYYRL